MGKKNRKSVIIGYSAVSHRHLHRHLKRQLHKIQLQQLGWHREWKNWRYKNSTLLILSLSILFLLASTPWAASAVSALGNTGYIGAFIAGMLFVSVFTVGPASVVLYNISENLHPLETAVFAGAGAVVSDYIIFKKIKGGLFDELAPLFSKLTSHKVTKLFYTPYFAWLLPIFGAIIIASPGPDEVGVGLLGLSKIKPWQFILITFLLNSVGIFFVTLVARSS